MDRKSSPIIDLSTDENERLSSLLKTAPGPAPWDAIYYPKMVGPNNSELVWDKKGSLTVLLSKTSGITYLALRLYCYIKASSPDRLLEWHIVWEKNARGFDRTPLHLELNLISTHGLKAITESILNEKAPIRFSSGVIVEGGVLATADVPLSLSAGTNEFHFPPGMKSEGEILIFADSTNDVLKREALGLVRFPRVIYVVDVPQDKIDVVRLDWWNDADHDFGYEWLSKVVRDPVTGNIIGCGIRAAPFILDSCTHKLLGFWYPLP